MNRNEHMGLVTKMGGLKVKEMIETVEQKMANGEQVSAGPVNEQEAQSLKHVREENQKSGERAGNR